MYIITGNEEKKVVTWPEYQEGVNNIARSLSFLTYFVWQRRWNWGFLDLTLSAVRGVWPLISPKRISLESNEKVMETEEMTINWNLSVSIIGNVKRTVWSIWMLILGWKGLSEILLYSENYEQSKRKNL